MLCDRSFVATAVCFRATRSTSRRRFRLSGECFLVAAGQRCNCLAVRGNGYRCQKMLEIPCAMIPCAMAGPFRPRFSVRALWTGVKLLLTGAPLGRRARILVRMETRQLWGLGNTCRASHTAPSRLHRQRGMTSASKAVFVSPEYSATGNDPDYATRNSWIRSGSGVLHL